MRRRAGPRAAKIGIRDERVATVGKAEQGGVNIGSSKCRTTIVKGTNEMGQMAILMKAGHNTCCDLIGLQETRRPG